MITYQQFTIHSLLNAICIPEDAQIYTCTCNYYATLHIYDSFSLAQYLLIPFYIGLCPLFTIDNDTLSFMRVTVSIMYM